MADVDPENGDIPEKEHSVRRSCRVFCVLLVCFMGLAVVITSIMCHVRCPRPEKDKLGVNAQGQVILIKAEKLQVQQSFIPPKRCKDLHDTSQEIEDCKEKRQRALAEKRDAANKDRIPRPPGKRRGRGRGRG